MRSLPLLPILLVFSAGVIVPLAVALNTMLAKTFKNPIFASLAVMLVATLFMAVVLIATMSPTPSADTIKSTPWYYWVGGILIAIYMVLMMFNVPKVGVGVSTSLVVAGQLMMGLLLDHLGAFGLPQASFSLGRFIGVTIIILGVMLLKIF